MTLCEVGKVRSCCVVDFNHVQAPWGGIKNSGFGRELGEWGLENFLSVKQVRRVGSKRGTRSHSV